MENEPIKPSGTDENKPEIISGGGTEAEQNTSEVLTFVLQHNGAQVNVRVLIHYPTYDIQLAGQPVATLEQDHHSNWFVASGKLEDALVQEIGRRIVAHITS